MELQMAEDPGGPDGQALVHGTRKPVVSKVGCGEFLPGYDLPGEGGLIYGRYGELQMFPGGDYAYVYDEEISNSGTDSDVFCYRLSHGPGAVDSVENMAFSGDSLEFLALRDLQGIQHDFPIAEFIPGIIYHSHLVTETEFEDWVSSAVIIEFELEPGIDAVFRIEISKDGIEWTDTHLSARDFEPVSDSTHFSANGNPPFAVAVNGDSSGIETFRYVRLTRSFEQDINSVFVVGLYTEFEDHVLVIPIEERGVEVELEQYVTGVVAGEGIPDRGRKTVGVPVAGLYGHLVIKPDGSWSYYLMEEKTSAMSGTRNLCDVFTYILEDGTGNEEFQTLTIPVEIREPVSDELVTSRIKESFTTTCEDASLWETYLMDAGEAFSCSTNGVPMAEIEGIPPFVVGRKPGCAVELFPALLIRCLDGAFVKKARVEIQDHFPEREALSFARPEDTNLDVNIEAGSGVVTISGSGSTQQFVAALRDIRYTALESFDSPSCRRVTVSVFDQNGGESAVDLEVTRCCDLSAMMGIFEVLESSSLFAGARVRHIGAGGAVSTVPFIAGHATVGATIDLSFRDEVGNLVAKELAYADGAGNWVALINAPFHGRPCAVEFVAAAPSWDPVAALESSEIMVANLDRTFLNPPVEPGCKTGDLIGSIIDVRPLRKLAFDWSS